MELVCRFLDGAQELTGVEGGEAGGLQLARHAVKGDGKHLPHLGDVADRETEGEEALLGDSGEVHQHFGQEEVGEVRVEQRATGGVRRVIREQALAGLPHHSLRSGRRRRSSAR